MDIYRQRQRPEYKTNRSAIINVLEEDEYVDYWTAEMAREFIQRRENAEQPWMLWIGFCGPHGPFDPPRRYAEMYPIEDMPFPVTFGADMSGKPEWMQRPTLDEIGEEERIRTQRCIAYYYAMMTQIDDMIGRVLAQLEQSGFADNTVVVTTADHGEMLGDWGRWGKGVFNEQVTRMPTIWHVPEPLRAGAGPPDTCDAVIENFSIAPTMLDYAGIEAPPEMQAPSLRPILEGEADRSRDMALTEYVDNNRGKGGLLLTTERYQIRELGQRVHRRAVRLAGGPRRGPQPVGRPGPRDCAPGDGRPPPRPHDPLDGTGVHFVPPQAPRARQESSVGAESIAMRSRSQA
jgi:choline-sulfatase